MKKLPAYKVVLNEQDKTQGVFSLDLVDDPAIQIDWITLKEELESYFLANVEKKILYGPILIQDFPIYRKNDKLGEHTIQFDRDQIELIANRFNEEGKTHEINLMHQNIPVNGFLAENWLVKDKGEYSKELGFSLKPGDWFGGVKIKDNELWNGPIKEGKLKGFSVGIKNELHLLNLSSQDEKNNTNTMENKEQLTEKLKGLDPRSVEHKTVTEQLAKIEADEKAKLAATPETTTPAAPETNAAPEGEIKRDDIAQMIDSRLQPLMDELAALKELISKEATQEGLSNQTTPATTTETTDVTTPVTTDVTVTLKVEDFEAVTKRLKDVEELLSNTTKAVNIMKPEPVDHKKVQATKEEDRIAYLTKTYGKK